MVGAGAHVGRRRPHLVGGDRAAGGILGPIRAKPVELKPGVMLAGSSTEHDGWVAHMERFSGSWTADSLASAAAWQTAAR